MFVTQHSAHRRVPGPQLLGDWRSLHRSRPAPPQMERAEVRKMNNADFREGGHFVAAAPARNKWSGPVVECAIRVGQRPYARGTSGGAQKTQNRGNEAKKSLKTKEVTQTMCAKRSHICAQKVANHAKKATLRCKIRTLPGAVRCGMSPEESPPAGPHPRALHF